MKMKQKKNQYKEFKTSENLVPNRMNPPDKRLICQTGSHRISVRQKYKTASTLKRKDLLEMSAYRENRM